VILWVLSGLATEWGILTWGVNVRSQRIFDPVTAVGRGLTTTCHRRTITIRSIINIIIIIIIIIIITYYSAKATRKYTHTENID